VRKLLAGLLGRTPIGWLQLTHNRGRFAAAIAGVAFANLLVFLQLGIQGAMETTGVKPYALFDTDILILPADARGFSDGGNVARQRMFEALSVPGVAAAAPLHVGIAEWRRSDGATASLEVYGIDPADTAFLGAEFTDKGGLLVRSDAAVVDAATRGLDLEAEALRNEKFEFNGRALTIVDLVEVGGGFTADGVMLVSDQTFFGLFPNSASSAPKRIMIKVDPGVSPDVVVDRLITRLATDSLRVATSSTALTEDLAYQATERPTGIIFGFGVLMGVLVGVVIVYQVLSTDVASHLREYATFKAMGYRQRFFLGIIVEQAIILAIAGFIPGVLAALGLYAALGGATGLPVVMDAGRALSVFLGTLAACIVSGALATRRLAGADPADLF